MKTIKNLFVFIFAAFAAMVSFSSCANEAWEEELGAQPQAQAVPVDYEPLDSSSVVVNYNDGTQDWGVKHSWTLEAEDTIKAQGTEAFKAAETLAKRAQDEIMFMYNYGKTNTVKVSGIAMSYKGRTIYPKNMSNMLVKGSREVAETVAKPYYELSATNYSLVYGSIRLASARQMFLVDEGYTPSFLRTIWNYKHGAFERNASLSNNIITVRCNNTATFCEEWDDNSYRDSLEVSYLVANKFAFSASEIKVNDLTTVIGKTFNFTNGTVTVAENEVNATWQSADVVENVMYKGINYKDSIAACVCAARTITFNTASKATIKFYDHNANDYAETSVTVKVTEKEKPVTLVRVDSTFQHNSFIPNATVSGNNMAVICNNTASFVKVWSNGKKDAVVNVGYKWTNNFTVSYNSSMSVDDKSAVLGRHNLNNGTVTVAGYTFTVTYKNRVCDDIMYNNKNYKQYAPICKATAVAINIAENGLTVIYDGEGETVTGNLPLTVTEKEKIVPTNVDGMPKLLSIADYYIDQHKPHEATTLMLLTENANGTYNVYRMRVAVREGVRGDKAVSETLTKKWVISKSQGDKILSSKRALCDIYDTAGNQYLGTVSSTDGQAKVGYFLQYYTVDGSLAYSLGDGTAQYAFSDAKGYRNAIRLQSTKVEDGTITASFLGINYAFTGTK